MTDIFRKKMSIKMIKCQKMIYEDKTRTLYLADDFSEDYGESQI